MSFFLLHSLIFIFWLFSLFPFYAFIVWRMDNKRVWSDFKVFKALVNEDTLLRTHCCPWCTRLGPRKLGNIYCRHKMFLNKIRNIFCVLDTKFGSATNVARGGKRRNIETFVSATMCPRLPGPLGVVKSKCIWVSRCKVLTRCFINPVIRINNTNKFTRWFLWIQTGFKNAIHEFYNIHKAILP